MAKPKLVFYLKPNSLEVYSDQADGSAKLDFPPEVVAHQEVLEMEKFRALSEKFLSEMGIEGLQAVILISKPLIYTKQFPFTEKVVDRKLIEDYLDTVPFDNNQIAKLEITGEESLMVLATNRIFYQQLVEVAQKLGVKVLAVVPEGIVELDVGKIFGDKKTLEEYNFLTSQPIVTPEGEQKKVVVKTEEDDEELAEEEEGSKKNKLLIAGGLIFIIGGMVVLGLMTGVIKNPFSSTPAVSPIPSALPSASPAVSTATESAVLVGSPSAVLAGKENLSSQIINGTGISGQATQVRDILVSLGYQNINLGATNLTGSDQTTVDFSSDVKDPLRQELLSKLREVFVKVTPREATGSAGFDILIVTGLGK